MINYFKNPTIYVTDMLKLSDVLPLTQREEFEGLKYTPCTPSQIRSFGFAKCPTTSLTEGNFSFNFKYGERKIIEAERKAMVDDYLKKFEEDQGFPPTKAQRDEAKQRALDKLIPKAFEQVVDVKAFYHAKTSQLVVSHSTVSAAVISTLTKLLSTFKTTTLYVDGVQHSLTKCLGDSIDLGEDFAIGRFGYREKLNFINEEKAQIKYSGDYDPEQVLETINSDYSLELAQLSSRGVIFDLTRELKVKNLSFDFDPDTQDTFDSIEERADYEIALTGYQLDLVADVGVDLVKVFEEKSEEYKNA